MSEPSPEALFERRVRSAVLRAFGTTVEQVALSYPPQASQGDLASPICFELARALRRPPREIAGAIAAAFETGEGIVRVEVAGGGYLNAFLDRTALLRRWVAQGLETAVAPESAPKTIVEHTNINPNKAAHIGHLRNAVLGDTLVRCLRRMGERVEIQNYIDDTGVQVADLVVGFIHLRREDLATVQAKYSEAALTARGERFDYVAWDLYAEVTRFYEEDRSRLALRDEVLHAMEAGGNAVADLAAHVSRRMVRHHLNTMERIGVRYDLLPRESDILALRFWEDAFASLRAAGAIRVATEGKNAGCWVMDLPGVEDGSGEDQKVIVRGNGTVTYVGKDIAYQMWKFGLLQRDFRYEPFDWAGGDPTYPVWATTHGMGVGDPPPFGRGSRVYNVIDTRQSYLQRVVALGLRRLGHEAEADRSIHFAYEMVALTPAAVRALFPDYPLSNEESRKPYLEMSGRRGLGVRADDLVDELVRRAAGEVEKRNPDLSGERLAQTARRIAIGALRYYMLRFSRNRVVAFDLDDALAFEGETGPYLQYSVVRARNILGKVAELHGEGEIAPPLLAGAADLEAIDETGRAEHWTLPLLLSRVPATIRQAVGTLEIASVAKHAYVLAQSFNSFYHRWPVAQEPDPTVRRTRTAIVRIFHEGMLDLLDLMGIEVPERM